MYNGSKAIAPGEGACSPVRRQTSVLCCAPETPAELLHSLRMLRLGLDQTRREIRIAKIGEGLPRRGAVEWAIAAVGHGTLPRAAPHGHGRIVHRRDPFGDVAEAVHASRRHIE